MSVRFAAVVTLLAPLALALPASAQSVISPHAVLAGKSSDGFSNRTQRVISIMGPEYGSAAPLKLPTKPQWQKALRREADAVGGAR